MESELSLPFARPNPAVTALRFRDTQRNRTLRRISRNCARASGVLALRAERALPPVLEQVLRGSAPRRIELRFESPRGDIVAGTLTLLPLLDHERRVLGACAVFDEARQS